MGLTVIKIVAANVLNDSPMTEPLRDPGFFWRAYLEAGALALPNGFDLSAESIHRKLDEGGRLSRSSAAA